MIQKAKIVRDLCNFPTHVNMDASSMATRPICYDRLVSRIHSFGNVMMLARTSFFDWDDLWILGPVGNIFVTEAGEDDRVFPKTVDSWLD